MRIPTAFDFPIGKPQPDVSDMISNTASHQFKRANVKAYLDQRNKGWEYNVPFMMRPTITDSTMKILPCRDAINNEIRQAKIAGGKEKLLGAFPQSGNARNQPKGLESDGFFEPKPLLPDFDNFFPSLISPIPLP